MADTFLLKAVDLTTTSATQIYKVPITDDTAVPRVESTTALVKSILVSEDSNNAYYGGQLLSASTFDSQNPDRLFKLTPGFIGDKDINKSF